MTTADTAAAAHGTRAGDPPSTPSSPRRADPAAAGRIFAAAARTGPPPTTRPRRGAFWVSLAIHVALPAIAVLTPSATPPPERTLAFQVPPPPPSPEPEEEELLVPPEVTPPPEATELVETFDPDEVVEARAPETPVGIGGSPGWHEALPAVRVGPRVRGRGTEPAPPAPAPEPAPEPPAPAGPSRRASMVADACDPPRYPSRARERSIEGRVVIVVTVRADGSVGGVEVETSSGHSILDDAAVKAVSTWKFEPALVNGVPVEDRLRLPIRFSLEDARLAPARRPGSTASAAAPGGDRGHGRPMHREGAEPRAIPAA